jgi:hypothetical protein
MRSGPLCPLEPLLPPLVRSPGPGNEQSPSELTFSNRSHSSAVLIFANVFCVVLAVFCLKQLFLWPMA